MIQLYCMGGIYFILGIVHFTHTGFYRPLMPKFLPAHDALIYWSGIAEIALGLGVLFPVTRSCELKGKLEYYGHCGKCWWCEERQWGFDQL